MSAELTALLTLAVNFNSGIYRLSPNDLAVLFYATNYWEKRFNWVSPDETIADVSDSDWDIIQDMTSNLLRTAKMPIIGLIVPFVTSSPAGNILPCDGSTYLRVDFPDLYEVLDIFFIVDADNFAVPDLRGRTIIGVGSGTGLTTRSVGDRIGEESHQLTESELAAHTHTIPATITTLVVEPGEVTALTPIPFTTQNTGSTGGDVAHNTMQPSYALNYGIVAS